MTTVGLLILAAGVTAYLMWLYLCEVALMAVGR